MNIRANTGSTTLGAPRSPSKGTLDTLLKSIRESNERFRQKQLANGRVAQDSDAYKSPIVKADPTKYGYRDTDEVTVYSGVGKSFSFSWKEPSMKLQRYQARIAMLMGYIDRLKTSEEFTDEEKTQRTCNARREIKMLRRAAAAEDAGRKRHVVIVEN